MSVRVCVTRERKAQRGAPAPVRGAALSVPVFSGELYLVQLVLEGPGGPWSLSTADLGVAHDYLTRAAPLIARYAGQYGPTSLTVSPELLPFDARLTAPQYDDKQLQAWVGQMIQEQGLTSNSAVIVLNPPGVTNTDAKESGGVGVLGYHGFAEIPYSFVNVLANGFNLSDPDDAFAEALSHEVAEMTVDPHADGSNPEVCDGCGTNCLGSKAYRLFFDETGQFLDSSSAFPPPFTYAFFLSAIAKPAAASDCPAPAASCAYPPP